MISSKPKTVYFWRKKPRDIALLLKAMNVSNDQTTRVEEICLSALEIKSPDDRKVFLDGACRGDAGLRLAADKWLATHAAADKFFQGIDVARLLTEAFLDLASMEAQGNAGGAVADKVPGQDGIPRKTDVRAS
jgi:hypothetical protein